MIWALKMLFVWRWRLGYWDSEPIKPQTPIRKGCRPFAGSPPPTFIPPPRS